MSLMIFSVRPGPRTRMQPSPVRLEVRNPTMRYNIWADRLIGMEPTDPDNEFDYGSLNVHFFVGPVHDRLIHTLDGYRWVFQMTRSNLVSVTVISGEQRTTLAENQQAESVVMSGGIHRVFYCEGNIMRMSASQQQNL